MFWENFGSIRIFAVGRENFSNEETLRFSLSVSRFVHKIFLQSIYLNGFRGKNKARANVDEREREKETHRVSSSFALELKNTFFSINIYLFPSCSSAD